MKKIIDLTCKSKSELKHLVRDRAKEAYDCGSGWGKAKETMLSIHKRQYLTSSEIAAIEKAKHEAYLRFMDRIAPISKSELNKNGHHSQLRKEALILPSEIKDKYYGINFYIDCLSARWVRGRTLYDIVPEEHVELKMHTVHNYDRRVRYWGKTEDGRMFYDLIVYPTSEPIAYEKRRRNWARAKKRVEFEKNAVKLVEDVENIGYEIKSLIQEYHQIGNTIHIDNWYLLTEKFEPEIVGGCSPVQDEIKQTQAEQTQTETGPCISIMPKTGETICFTGTLSSMGRKEASFKAEKVGLTVMSSVSRGLTYLVSANQLSESSKARKARQLGVQIIGETDFLTMLNKTSQANNA